MSFFTHPKVFPFTSAAATTHTITHSLNEVSPVVIVFNSANGEVVIPTATDVLTANAVRLTFFSAVAVRGKIIKET